MQKIILITGFDKHVPLKAPNFAIQTCLSYFHAPFNNMLTLTKRNLRFYFLLPLIMTAIII